MARLGKAPARRKPSYLAKVEGKKARMVVEFVKDHNLRAAAIRAGFSGSLTDPNLLDIYQELKPYIDRHEEELAKAGDISLARLCKEISISVLLDITTFADSDGNLKDGLTLDDLGEAGRAIKAITRFTRRDGTIEHKLEFYSKLEAADKYAKLKGYLDNKTPAIPPVNLGIYIGSDAPKIEDVTPGAAGSDRYILPG